MLIAIPPAGFVPTTTGVRARLAPVLVFAGSARFVGGPPARRKADAFAGTALRAYGASDVLVATSYPFQVAGVFTREPDTTPPLGAERLCFAFISLLLGLAACAENATFAISGALVPRLGPVAINNLGFGATIGHIGGYLLILAAVLACYGASALVLNSGFERSCSRRCPDSDHHREAR